MNPTIRRLLARRAEPLPPLATRLLLVGATTVVVGLAVAAWKSVDLSLRELNWWAVALSVAVAAPASLWLRAMEFDVSARMLGDRPTRRRSFEIAVAASAANLLPIPGSLIVNVSSLSKQASYGSAIKASAVPGVIWVGFVGTIGGAAMAVGGAPALGGLVAAVGAVVLAVGWILFVRLVAPESRLALALRVAAVELGYIAISVVRLSLALSALRVSASLDQVLALSVAGALTVAVGFFPAGLGLREVLVGALAPIVGLPFAVGVLVGVADRLAWFAFLGLVMLLMAIGSAAPADRPNDSR